MLDFVRADCHVRRASGKTPGEARSGDWVVEPIFQVGRTKDLMIRGRDFYAVWDEENHIWSTEPTRIVQMIDGMLYDKAEELARVHPQAVISVMSLSNYRTKAWEQFRSYCKSLPDNYTVLDQKVCFSGEETRREDYISKRLPYRLSLEEPRSYNQLMGTLYSPTELRKLEWGIGSVLAGESGKIQKFFVLYGPPGSGKSTALDIYSELLKGYGCSFNAKALGTSGNAFSMEPFRSSPLVAIEHDGDLSRIEDNTRLNSIVSHEPIVMNEKNKAQYTITINAMLFIGTNEPVRITSANTGLMRRLIDVNPSGERVSVDEYRKLSNSIPFELGAIANKCLSVYLELGPDAYDRYRATAMADETNDFYNFMKEHYGYFTTTRYVVLKEIWSMYKEWAEATRVPYPMSMRKVKSEVKNYFEEQFERKKIENADYYNVYSRLKTEMFFPEDSIFSNDADVPSTTITMNTQSSLFDELYSDQPAQYATDSGIPSRRWDSVSTKLSDLDTSRLHYVKVPENHIVIDFDIRNESGEKDRELNLAAASKLPSTYSELSRSGNGVHLHYIYDGDVDELAPLYSENVEIKVFKGKQALRRQLTYCNDVPVMHIQSGLPTKGDEEKMMDFDGFKNENALRTLIAKNLRKEVHPGTKPSVDFIYKALEDAYSQPGFEYDVSDMETAVLEFANSSTNHALYCVKLVSKMKFKSESERETDEWQPSEKIVFFDVEVYPNLFIVCWKYKGSDVVTKMVNPDAEAIEGLCRYKLIGFNNRRYDNHILYGRMMGYDNARLYKLSSTIVGKDREASQAALFREAYNISYADVYDFASAPHKMSLKKWEVKLGIHHQEMGLPWDQPAPEDKWDEIAEYCSNDVAATEAVFDHIYDDFVAREILAKLSGLPVNSSTRTHMTRIIFGKDRNPQEKLKYTDLSEMFPGYEFKMGKSTYMGEEVGEGGYVYAEPGMYENVGLFDVASMHPASILALDYLGPYTQTYADIRQARIFIKRGNLEEAKKLMDGKLAKFLDDPDIDNKALADALKTALNSLYGYTCARFDCEFKHPMNKDNIVAKRGALFMVTLKNEVQKMGYTVAHIKTDSIKIPNYDNKVKDFIFEFGKKYGYEFEHEATYDKMCLVNDAVYIAHDEDGWHATGAQFQQPYIFKTLFSKEDLTFDDLCEVRAVNEGDIYLDYDEDLPEGEHNYHFVGRVGLFCPVLPGKGGGVMYRIKDGKNYAVQKTKGYRWHESERVQVQHLEDDIDMSYFEEMAEEAIQDISVYGNFEEFVKE